MKALRGIGYWILQLTWGIVMNIAGVMATLFCLVFLKGRIHKNGYGFITEVGGNWGGLSLGAFALCGNYSTLNEYWFAHTRKHEFGHSIQNMIFGPLFLFIVAIPSAIRYWYDVLEKNHKSERDDEWYDSAWFEGTASRWGTKWVDLIESK